MGMSITAGEVTAGTTAWLGGALQPADQAALAIVAPAVAALVSDLPISTERPETASAGAVMLAARLVRRRSSPQGIVTALADGGAGYVMRHDPDIGIMLGLGAHQWPVIA